MDVYVHGSDQMDLDFLWYWSPRTGPDKSAGPVLPDQTGQNQIIKIHFNFKVILISNYHFVVVMHPSWGDQG